MKPHVRSELDHLRTHPMNAGQLLHPFTQAQGELARSIYNHLIECIHGYSSKLAHPKASRIQHTQNKLLAYDSSPKDGMIGPGGSRTRNTYGVGQGSRDTGHCCEGDSRKEEDACGDLDRGHPGGRRQS